MNGFDIATEITDHQADLIIDSLHRTFKKRRAVKNIIDHANYGSILNLNKEDLEYCTLYMEQQSKSERIISLTNIIDFFSDGDLKHENLKTIFWKFKTDLAHIA
jgi:hypothetical protein